VELVGKEDSPNLAQKIADAAGSALGTELGRTWVKLRYLPSAHYAENGATDPEMRPVFVSLLLGRSLPAVGRKELSLTLARAIGEVVGRPIENVHILFEPDARGRMAFGGVLVE